MRLLSHKIFSGHFFPIVIMAVLLLNINIIPEIKKSYTQEINKNLLARNYLNVIESGNRKVVKDFITCQFDSTFLKRLPIEMHVTFQLGFYFMSGGLGYEYIDSLHSEKNEIKALLKNKLTGALLELRIPVNEVTPKKINNFVEFKVVPPKKEMPASSYLSDKEIINRLHTCLSLLTQADEFSGAVMFAKNGNPLFSKAVGQANKADEITNRTDTKFNIASVGKVFTGIAIAQLVQQGYLSFDDPLSKYLPVDWLNQEISQKIQIRHLLTHTSGLGDYFGKLYSQSDKFIFRDLDDYKILLKDQTLDFEPGSKWSYSNTGMLLLGVVIEKITGKSYFDYLRENIFTQANMKNTEGYEKDRPTPNRSIGYLKEYSENEIRWKDNTISRVVKGTPSGGCYSTTEDLLNFDTALRTNVLLNKELTRLVLSPKPEINSPFYGYGFFIENSNIGRIVKHSGDGTGINCQYSSYLDAGYTVIVLSNYGRPAADILDNVLYQMLLSRYK